MWVLGVIAAFAAYLQLARTRAINSDGASNALQAWDMLHGNLLLHGWSLSDVSFYTTELPQYMLVEALRGLNQDVVRVAAAMTYTLVMLLAALLAKGNSTGRPTPAGAYARPARACRAGRRGCTRRPGSAGLPSPARRTAPGR